MAKKILAILLALTFVFAFAACGGKGDEETTTTPAETTADPFAEVEDTTAAIEDTTAAVEDTTAAVVEDTTVAVEDTTVAGETTTAATTEAAKAVPQTKAEIVEYYNTAINNAKKNSKSIHSNYMKHAVAGEITGIPSALDSIGQSLIKDNMGEDDSKKNVTWSTAEDKNAFFPVENETWASKLTADDVKDAKLVEKDGKYIIRITTKDDARSEGHKHGSGHAPKAFNVVLPGIIDGYIPGIVKSMFSVGTVATAYPASTVQVTVDAATGNVVSANYMMYWTLFIPLGDTDVVLPFSTENDYTINW
ncbi:MAG: hypothetical protein IKK63_01030 [Clostridia bacterium]|nr:hypothetical protein [Clostridia bacterium]MBR3819731.1 hypothetical protein [Clostridia bacterium]